MLKSTEALRARVREIMPDLAIEHLERNLDGGINDIVIVNRQWVFRFAKEEKYFHLLEAERKILEFIRPHISLSIPTVVHHCDDCWVYPLLTGQTLSLKLLHSYDEAAQDRIAGQVGSFLHQLHSIDISAPSVELPITRAPVTRAVWVEYQAEVQAKIYPLLQRYQVEYLDDLFGRALGNPHFFDYAPALIHGDLASYHLLFDSHSCQVTGVLDFGMAGVGDPANDFGLLINIYGESFVRRMRPAYPDLEQYLPRARFYAQGLELEWTLRGLDSGENFWFTAHIAGARDLSYRP